jgi:EAL domain-containing protein (putative c-di-GMP-specific phosphodiesterase class I)
MTMDVDHATRLLMELKELGLKISIDDFGTGYSSLSYLKMFPIDKLKIDQSFVRDMMLDPNDAAIVSTIISMTRHLNLKVIAEGVETEEQLGFLRQNNCTEIQGYWFSPPLKEDRMIQLLAKHH